MQAFASAVVRNLAAYLSFHLQPFLGPLQARRNDLQQRWQAQRDQLLFEVYYYFSMLFKIWLVCVVLFFTLCWSLFWATLHYLLLYYWLMPNMQERVPVFLDYSAPMPMAVTPLLTKQWSYSPLKESDAPSKEAREWFLYPGQHYDVTLELLIPDSPANLDLPVLNIQLDLYHSAHTGDPAAFCSRGHELLKQQFYLSTLTYTYTQTTHTIMDIVISHI